jgi:hypothetical protein
MICRAAGSDQSIPFRNSPNGPARRQNGEERVLQSRSRKGAPSTIQRSSADGVAGHSLFAIRNRGRELRETNVGGAVLGCVFNSLNVSRAFETLMIQEMPYSNGCCFLHLCRVFRLSARSFIITKETGTRIRR